jgi:hypothetical protein
LPLVSLTPAANLPPVSTTLVKLVAKFAAGVVDTGGKLSSVSLTPTANLLLVDIGGKFVTGINNKSKTGGKIFHQCR